MKYEEDEEGVSNKAKRGKVSKGRREAEELICDEEREITESTNVLIIIETNRDTRTSPLLSSE